MDRLALPKFDTLARPAGVSFEILPSVAARWNAAIQARDGEENDDAQINIYDAIGLDPWTGEGMTAKRVAGIMRSIGDRPITVNLNSPGGDVFEGMAIYNLLRDHSQPVTTRVIGLAASAASVIAMAGDEIQIARAGFMMLHNVWSVVVGNRNDLREVAAQLETFDDALASVYAARSGGDKKTVAGLMDSETWFSGEQAVENGFADGLLPADIAQEKDAASAGEQAASLRNIDALLARRGMPRGERRALINMIKESVGTRDAAGHEQDRDTRDAVAKGTQDAAEVEEKARRLAAEFRQGAGI